MSALLSLGFGSVGYRLVAVQLHEADRLREAAEDNTHSTILRASLRGEIRDRHGNLLAGSLLAKTVVANPTLIQKHGPELAKRLAPLLGLDEAELAGKLRTKTFVSESGELKEDRYVVLRRLVPMQVWEKIQATLKEYGKADEANLSREEKKFLWDLRARAIFCEASEEQTRFYPNGSLAAHVLGFVGSVEREGFSGAVRDLEGKEGIEAAMNSSLTGVGGWRMTEVVRGKELVASRAQDVEPRPGHNVVLTLDAGLQHIVESELAESLAKHSPVSISAVIVRPSTGEILAMATLPSFEPGRPGIATADARRNRVITDVAEPGSTFKIVAVSASLNEGLLSLDTRIDCGDGRFFFAGRYLKDDHPAGLLSVLEIVTKSSNIGTAKVAIQLGANRLYDYIRRYGFGGPTGLILPGEVSGIVHSPTSRQWTSISISRVPIGQGIAVTPIQSVMAMAAIANGGVLMQPLLVRRVEDADGQVVSSTAPRMVRRVVSEGTAKEMVDALKTVVSDGTAKRAQLEGYTAAGKTGTAEKPGPGGYLEGKYFSSFVGFFPADQPELCIGVFLDEPDAKFQYYGGVTASPAFKRIAEKAAKYLAIKPEIKPEESDTSRRLDATKLAKAGR